MASPWKIAPPIETVNFAEILSSAEQIKRDQDNVAKKKLTRPPDEGVWEDYSILLDIEPSETSTSEKTNWDGCDSDLEIARMLQLQFDQEYNDELKRIEQKRNKQSKVTITLDRFRRGYDTDLKSELEFDAHEEQLDDLNSDWDRFETNERELEKIPKCGFRVDEEGEMITKHDANLCGVRNACRVMSFPIEFPTGDGAGFDMKLSNQVFNQLKAYSHRGKGGDRKHKMYDRKENLATVEMGLDQRTHLLLYKFVNNQILEQINGIISTGKEAVILHANTDPAYKDNTDSKQGRMNTIVPPEMLPKECAIKIFKTTLNDFKQRDRYIKDDYRFKDRFSKQNKDVVINLWAEKEMQNLKRMQKVGINCPFAIILKKHVLVMSFIGNNNCAAPKLKNVELSTAELSLAYEEVVSTMHKLYNEAKLVHADLSEYNILWHDGKCWFIDVAQAVEPEHPSALEFLMRDCDNIISFFTKRKLPKIFTKEQLFEHITSMNAEVFNASMLERIHGRGTTDEQADYPFELALEKSQQDKKRELTMAIDNATNALTVLSMKCGKTETNGTCSDVPNLVKTNTAEN